MRYLVIVESPNKKDKIASYLNTIPGHEFMVEASLGHIRYFEDGLKSIDTTNNFKPTYAIYDDKVKVVTKLKALMKKVDEVLIATDPDREGEAIGFHIAYSLGLNPENTKRISFNEITKTAIISAFNKPRKMDFNLFNAQQARSVLDLLIGFEISPVLWKFIKTGLSAGRCQSPALRLIFDRETEINDFKSNKFYNLTGYFPITSKFIAIAVYFKKIESKETAIELLPNLVKKEYTLTLKEKKNATNNPPAPFITSTIQQEASSRFGMSPKSTMSCLQKLYEKGKITYLRTDSTSISQNFIDEVKEFLNDKYPNKFEQRTYASKVANAQEAHECIRPVSTTTELDDSFNQYEKKVFDLIMKRSLASQMIKFKEDIYTYELKNGEHIFTFSLKKVIELGWKAIYEDYVTDDDGNQISSMDNSELIKELSKKLSDSFKLSKLIASETITKPKTRYTEASLIKELEERGIGRPSTFSAIVSTLLERDYVIKKTKDSNNKVTLEELSIEPNKNIQTKTKEVNATTDTNKLAITEVGRIVTNFMNENFEKINSYDFTSEVEADLDKISKYSSLEEDDTIDTITLERAIELLKYPINLGKYKSSDVFIKKGKYGLYIEHKKVKKSIKENVTLDEAIKLLTTTDSNVIKEFSDIKILNGPYGPYIKKGKENYKIPKDTDITKITKKEALEIIKMAKDAPKKPFKKFTKTNKTDDGIKVNNQ
jgi:DNA topoisomerase-1